MTSPRLSALVFALSVSVANAARADVSTKPKLVVLLAVDQMRGDYFEWYGAQWTGGLRRLYDKGAWFRKAAYPYLSTITCPGHATIGTGAYPRSHGMVGNLWYDRSQKRSIECTEDAAVALVPHAPPRLPDGKPIPLGRGDSAANLAVPTLGDEMKAQLKPTPQLAGFSWKARASLNLTGHAPDVALWWENASWVTSVAISPHPIPWVERFVSAHPIDTKLVWNRLRPPGTYKYEDDGVGEAPPPGWSSSFPHPVMVPAPPGVSQWLYGRWGDTPFVDQRLGELARTALKEMNLGRGESTDLLAVSFSMTDLIGHRFGPHSHELQDVLARLDRVMGDLLDALDKQVGKGKYVVALSADHGVSPLPERMKKEGQDAGRISGVEIRAKVNAAVVAQLGPAAGPYVVAVEANDIYLAPGVYDRLRAKPGAIAQVLAALRTVAGVSDAFEAAEISDAAAAKDLVRRAAALSHFAGRSGDLVIAPKRYWFPGTLGTSHGTTESYDQHVPVLFYGAGIKPGRYDRAASPADIVPTLGAIIGVATPKAEGTVLREALEPARAAVLDGGAKKRAN